MSKAARKHEDFEVNQNAVNNRMKVVRIDRMEVDGLDCAVEVNGTRYKVQNISPFGLAFRSPNQHKLGEEIHRVAITLLGKPVCEASLRIVRQFETEDETGYVVGTEVVGEPIAISRVIAIRDANELIGKHKEDVARMQQVPAEFRRRVFEIKDWLEEIQSKTNEVAERLKSEDGINRHEYEEGFVELIGAYLTEAMPAKNQALAQYLPGKDDEALKASIEFFRQRLYDLIYQAPFANRVFHKPLGYAGDYEMMNIIYRDKASGDSLFAKCLNHYWVSEPAAQAVRNRADYLISRIKEAFASHPKNEEVSFLSVACGPAMEWQRLISEVKSFNDRPTKIYLLDQDERALKHAQRQIKTHSSHHRNKFTFEFLNTAIRNVIARGMGERKYDMIYSAGLFDYFSDPVAQMAAMKLFAAIKPGGSLIIGNFNVTNPNSMMMNLALDWHLIYRSEEDLRRLFEPLGGKIRIDKESLDINLFCVIEKQK